MAMVMAGTNSLNSLLASSPRSNPAPFRFQTSCFSSNGTLLSGTSFLSLNCRSRISRPIRACGLPNKEDGGGGMDDRVMGSGNEVFKALSNFANNSFR